MLIIFDWDGTLIDSTGKIVQCMQEAAKQVGLHELAANKVRQIIGLGLPEAIFALYPETPLEQRELLRTAYSDVYLSTATHNPNQLYEGVEQGLHDLRQQGHSLAVATGKSRRGLNRALSDLGWQDFFDSTRCADETASKPNPLMVNQLLDELFAEADDAVMVGDTTFDLEMAQHAGIKSIGVSYGAHSVEHLLSCEPISIIDHFSDIHQVLKQL